jgi:arylsulfatase A-like enzyme
MTLMDIAPTVLHLLGIEDDFAFDGTSVLRKI